MPDGGAILFWILKSLARQGVCDLEYSSCCNFSGDQTCAYLRERQCRWLKLTPTLCLLGLANEQAQRSLYGTRDLDQSACNLMSALNVCGHSTSN